MIFTHVVKLCQALCFLLFSPVFSSDLFKFWWGNTSGFTIKIICLTASTYSSIAPHPATHFKFSRHSFPWLITLVLIKYKQLKMNLESPHNSLQLSCDIQAFFQQVLISDYEHIFYFITWYERQYLMTSKNIEKRLTESLKRASVV